MTPDLRSTFDRLVVDGATTAWFPSVYEPETHQFGGPEATDAVHRWFDRDTAAWGMWTTLARRPRVSANVVSLAVLVDLFSRCLEGDEEVWDVVCNLAHLYGEPTAHAQARTAAPAIDLARLEAVAPELAPLATIYRAANGALASDLERLWRDGALTGGRRGILPFVAAFHWNRYRTPLVAIGKIVAAMRAAHDPKAGFVGADR